MNNNKLKKEETLIIIVIILVLMSLCLIPLFNCINNSNKVSYFTSVYNIAYKLRLQGTLQENESCVYTLTEKEYNDTNIEFLYIIIHNEDNKTIYSVYSKMKDFNVIIDTYNFEQLSLKEKEKNWVSKDKASEKFSNIIYKKEKYNTCTFIKK